MHFRLFAPSFQNSLDNNSIGKFLSAVSLLHFFFIQQAIQIQDLIDNLFFCRWFILMYFSEQFPHILPDYLVSLILYKTGSISTLLLFGCTFYKWLRFRYNYNFHLESVWFLFVQTAASVLLLILCTDDFRSLVWIFVSLTIYIMLVEQWRSSDNLIH